MTHRLLNLAAGLPPGVKTTQHSLMNLKQFKQEAGVDTLQFRPCHNNKDVERCMTSIGVIFKDKNFNAKSKVQDVEQKFDDNGNPIYWLTNTAVSSVL